MAIQRNDNIKLDAPKPIRTTDIVGVGWVYLTKETIPISMRYQYMQTVDANTGNKWRLEGGVSNSNWVLDNGSGDAGQITSWAELILLVGEIGQQSIALSKTLSINDSFLLFINGIFYKYGVGSDYHITANPDILNWHGDFNLEPSDNIILKYRQ